MMIIPSLDGPLPTMLLSAKELAAKQRAEKAAAAAAKTADAAASGINRSLLVL